MLVIDGGLRHKGIDSTDGMVRTVIHASLLELGTL